MDDNKNELRTRAVALREAGRTRDQIRRELGLTSGWAVNELLDREPARHPGLRARAKDDLRQRARELRSEGKTYPEIAAELGVSKSSVSLWVRDLPSVARSPAGQSQRTAGIRMAVQRRRDEIEVAKAKFRVVAVGQIGEVNDRDAILLGSIAYWCEGSKSKPWNKQERVVFINSDPGLIRLFLRFLNVVGVTWERVSLRLHIHESADVVGSEAFWAEVTGFPAAGFRRATLKKHNPKTVRKNVNDDYHGCLVIDVAKSSELYRKIEIWAGIAMGSLS